MDIKTYITLNKIVSTMCRYLALFVMYPKAYMKIIPIYVYSSTIDEKVCFIVILTINIFPIIYRDGYVCIRIVKEAYPGTHGPQFSRFLAQPLADSSRLKS